MRIIGLLQALREPGLFFVSILSLFVSAAVLIWTQSFNKWQKRLEQQKLRFQLYDRRMPVYLAFRELLQGLPEKNRDEILYAFQKAKFTLLEVPLLFEDDSDLQAYLGDLCMRVTDLLGIDLTLRPEDVLYDKDNRRAEESRERRGQYEVTRIKIRDEFLPELPKRFEPFMKLTDLSRQKNRRLRKIARHSSTHCW